MILRYRTSYSTPMLLAFLALVKCLLARPGAEDGALYAKTRSERSALEVSCLSLVAKQDTQSVKTSILADTVTPAYCASLYKMLGYYSNIHDWRKLYDSSKEMVEVCPNSGYVTTALHYATSGASALLRQDTSIMYEYRDWLRSVLYLNTTDPAYFCSAVEQIAATYDAVSDTTETLYWKQQNRTLAVLRWLWTNDTTCHTSALKAQYNTTRQSQREDWLNDTTVVYDTTLPTMAELGLDTLLAKHSLYQNQNQNHNAVQSNGLSILSAVGTSPNPTSNGTLLYFGMSQAAYLRVEVYDLLGNAVCTGGFEQYLGAGNHSVPIDLTTLASGSYYARIVTAYGETRTVKIVRQ